MEHVRIAVRESATELTREQTDQVSGGRAMNVTDNDGLTCSADPATDCWITGGNIVKNDD